MKWVFVLVMALGGCSVTAGDGDLVDDWAVLPSASARVPPGEACYDTSGFARKERVPDHYRTVDCAGPHGVETFHVGRLPDTVTTIPAAASGGRWAAFEACEAPARVFLGGDWFTARLYLTLHLPTVEQWTAGARWFTCQLTETLHVTTGEVVQRSGSLRGALTGAAALAHRCTSVLGATETSWNDMVAVDCAQPHDAEFAGAFKVPGTTMPTGQAQREPVLDECWNVVARHLGGTADGIRVGYIPWGLNADDWTVGDRYVRCFAWSSEKKTTGSMKGLGNRAPA